MHWADQEPLALDGPLKGRLQHWMTLVHRGQVIDAYRVFLGLMQDKDERRAALAELAFAGLIDVQDRAFQNRSYTTGHKSFRARATVELGDAIGWDDARVLDASALDIAVARWYSLYEMATTPSPSIWGQVLRRTLWLTERERALGNREPMGAAETGPSSEIVRASPAPANIGAGAAASNWKSRSILDAIQSAPPSRDRDQYRRSAPAAALLRVLQRWAGSGTVSPSRSASSCCASPPPISTRPPGTSS